MATFSSVALLSLVTLASAQYDTNGYNYPSDPSGGGGDSASSGSQFGGFDMTSFLNDRQKILIAHGVLASLAFVILFPLGSILIRLGSSKGIWLIHGLFQLFAYAVYIAAFGLGIWFVRNIPVNLLDHYHPIIGIVVFCLLFFQPILGFMHHVQFKKHSRRTIWSHGHLWLGRLVVTLGMINGGLGMLLATESGFFIPSRGQMIAYGVVAGIMWLLWVTAAVTGESRRTKARPAAERAPEEVKEEQYA